MFAIVIKDSEVYLSDSNLLTGKGAICFEFLLQKRKIDKKIASALYYKY